MKRILFFAESVTLAHLARPYVLANAVKAEFDTHLGTSSVYEHLFQFDGITRHRITSLSPHEFTRRLNGIRPVYRASEIEANVAEDLKLIDEIKPDILVGDFRLSLYISARLRKIPHLTITNAYWSPLVKQRFVVPDLPFVRYMGTNLSQAMFSTVFPLAFYFHARPFIRLCEKYGVNPPGNDIRSVYTAGDITLFADIPELYSNSPSLNSDHFIGPVMWNPVLDLPEWWNQIPTDKPRVYVTMGSSGRSSVLATILQGVERAGCTAIVSGAGNANKDSMRTGTFFSDFLPGNKVAEMVDLVICNGGSPTSQQALFAGRPVMGIAGNLDQHLNMQSLRQSGVGEMIRSDAVTATKVTAGIKHLLENQKVQNRAEEMASIMSRYDAGERFLSKIKQL